MTNPAPDAPQTPAAVDPYAPPTAALNPYAAQAPVLEAPSIAPRVAGGLLLVNAALVLLELVALPAQAASGSTTPFDNPARGTISAFIDIGIGIALLGGNRGVIPWAIMRAALGMVLLAGLALLNDPVVAVLQMMMCGSILALLIGNAGKPRIAVGASFFGLYALVNLIGLAATVTGRNPIASLLQSASGDIETAAAGEVTGEASHYHITAPSDRWHLRKPEAAKKDNPLADRWITRPDKDAHAMVIVESVPGSKLDIDLYTDAVIASIKDAMAGAQIVSREPLRTDPKNGRMLHVKGSVGGMELEYYYGVFAQGERGFQVIAWASNNFIGSVREDLVKVCEGFVLPPN
jgi:hypothetical protein